MGRQLHVTYKLLISKGLNRNKCGGFAANVSGPINQARVLKWDQRFELSAHITASGSSRNVNRHANGSNYQLQGINGTKRLTWLYPKEKGKQTNKHISTFVWNPLQSSEQLLLTWKFCSLRSTSIWPWKQSIFLKSYTIQRRVHVFVNFCVEQ